jgi:putative heme iron utilization protein
MASKPRSFTGREARNLLRRARTGTLASLNAEGGTPYASLVNVATDIEGQPLILVSTLAWHTRNLLADGRASLMVAEPPASGDALTGPRVTVMGRFVPSESEQVRRRYLARHPQAALYASFGDFGFWRMEPELAHAVAGFGRIETLNVNEVFPSAPDMAELEAGAIAHMNEDHADAVRRYATRLLGASEGDWKIAAIDPDGAEITTDEEVLRLTFPEPVYHADALRRCLSELGKLSKE